MRTHQLTRPVPTSLVEIEHQSEAHKIVYEKICGLFFNDRGEAYNSQIELINDPNHGDVWRNWAAHNLPVDVYREFGMVEVQGSEEWLNVVEHNVFVAAYALAIGQKLVNAGVKVDLSMLVRAAIIHDASKRLDIERKLPREAEATDANFGIVIKKFGYTEEEIKAAKNTGRSSDRYIQDPLKRFSAVAEHSIEATIIGYADARTLGVHSCSVDDAKVGYIKAKPKDEEFFTKYWYPYYITVENYLRTLDPTFDPTQFSDAKIFQFIKNASDALILA